MIFPLEDDLVFADESLHDIFKDILILIYGNIVINELSLRQRAVSNFRDKSDPARDARHQLRDCPGHSGTVCNSTLSALLQDTATKLAGKLTVSVAMIR